MFHRRIQRVLRRMGRADFSSAVQQANQLMVSQDYSAAADAFKELAQDAEEHFPHRAPFLFMEAGHAAILGGQTQIGMAHLRRGLTIFASQGRILRLRTYGRRAIDELNAQNLIAEADEIAKLLNGNLPKEIPGEHPTVRRRPILPTHCPSCGAAVRPNEIDWLDEITAECDYCGSPIRP